MATDGTGGVAYLKRVDGVPHVFVSRYAGGHWLAPIRVDTEEPYAASWPRIGAAEGGELIVVWATPFATRNGKLVYELLGSELGPGGERFGSATIVDPNIEEATGTSPDLAVSSTGQADVVYRVVEPGNTSVPLLRPGDVVEQVRLAHFNGERWADLGAINRNPGVSMRPPTRPTSRRSRSARPVTAWSSGRSRKSKASRASGPGACSARRSTTCCPSAPTTFNGAPIPDDADAPSVAVSWLGQADVAYRQSVGPGSPLPGPRIFLNILPNGESTSGAEFAGASIADSAVSGGAEPASDRRASTSTKRKTCGCCTTPTGPRA